MNNNMDELKNKVTKTGTTLVGIVCKDGVVVAADRQATAGSMVAEKNTRKIAQRQAQVWSQIPSSLSD